MWSRASFFVLCVWGGSRTIAARKKSKPRGGAVLLGRDERTSDLGVIVDLGKVKLRSANPDAPSSEPPPTSTHPPRRLGGWRAPDDSVARAIRTFKRKGRGPAWACSSVVVVIADAYSSPSD